MIRYCKTCLNPSTRPNTKIDEHGYCLVCSYEKSKKKLEIDWSYRLEEVKKILNWGHENSSSCYDCIVPVSGGKDSHRQACFVRDELGFNPLLVSCVYPPEELHERGAANLSNLIELGFDCISLSLDPIMWKTLMKHGFYTFGNFFRSTEMALYAIPVHVAIAYKVPLLCYGENPAFTIGEIHGGLDGDASGIREGNTIKGGPMSLNYSDATKFDFHFYEYPNKSEIKRAGIRIIYLGYYIRDWYGHRNSQFAISKGLTTRTELPEETGDLWGYSGLDEEFRLINQHIKYLKYGFGHVTDQVCEAIHQGIMTRKEALELVKTYDGKCGDKYIEALCNYFEITTQEFWKVVDSFVNKDLFIKREGQWCPRFEII